MNIRDPAAGNHRLELRDRLWCLLGADLLVVWIAHSHSGSQFLPHLPWHSNSAMLPPQVGQIRLMIDEIMLALSSPGIRSIVLMVVLPYPPCRRARGGTAFNCVRRSRGPRSRVAGEERLSFRERSAFATEFVWSPVSAATSLSCDVAIAMPTQNFKRHC
jgi:hypothetical protein